MKQFLTVIKHRVCKFIMNITRMFSVGPVSLVEDEIPTQKISFTWILVTGYFDDDS